MALSAATITALGRDRAPGEWAGQRLDAPPDDDTASRIIDAALASYASVGVSKTTLDDVAREAGCSRATVYRYFAGKPALLEAVVDAEIRRLAGIVDALADSTDTLEDFLVGALHRVGVEFEAHAALQYVLAVEPEVVLPHVVFEGAERVFAVAGAVLGPALRRFLADDEVVSAGEWLCRVALTYLFSPSQTISLGDEASVRHLVRTFVLPGLRAPVAS